jgi:hypothetical protein
MTSAIQANAKASLRHTRNTHQLPPNSHCELIERMKGLRGYIHDLANIIL